MANYQVNITDSTGDVWAFSLYRDPSGTNTLVKSISALDIHVLAQKVSEWLKNDITANGHN